MPNPAFQDTNAEYTYGDIFNYNLWTASTEITLTNVPWNNDYRDIVKFDNQGDLDAFINESPVTNTRIEGASYARINRPVRLAIPFNKAYMYNYLRASNPAQPIANDRPKAFYYFITDVEYVSPSVTQFNVQLDVWQTFGYEAKFGNSYLQQGHAGIANEKNFDNFGRDYLTIPEGLDTGNEYRHVAKRTQKIFEYNTGSGLRDYNILVCSTVDLTADPGDYKDPKLRTARGENLQGMPSGAEYYAFANVAEFRQFMAAYSNFPWVTQGITSISAVPNLVQFGYQLTPVTVKYNVRIYKIAADTGLSNFWGQFVNWRNNDEIRGDIPARYRHLNKFMVSPYLMVEVTTWTGSPIVLKPEAWADENATLTMKMAIAPPGARAVFYPNKYNANPGSPVESKQIGQRRVTFDDNGDYLDISTQISNFPQFAIVNNQSINYLASNAHGINQQFANADWSQQRALQGNATSYDQASMGMYTTSAQGDVSRAAATQSTAISNNAAGMRALQSGMNSVANAATSATPMGIAGAGLGIANAAIGYGIETSTANANLANQNSASLASQNLTVDNAGFNRDTNKALADWSARGDYAQSIAAINAKVQDARLTQPSTSGQVGGEMFNIINDAAEVSTRWKMIGPAEIRAIGEYWLRYGYQIRQFAFIPSSLMVMTNFTYWKVSELYLISTKIPESYKQAIRGIFEKGVTVWKDPKKIGQIDIADNRPIAGYALDSEASTKPPVVTPPDNIDPIEDDDKMILVKALERYWGVSKGYVRVLDEEGMTIPSRVYGIPLEYSRSDLIALFYLHGIPVEFADYDVFHAEWPGNVWSFELAAAKVAANEAQVDRDNAVDIKKILGDIMLVVSDLADDGAAS